MALITAPLVEVYLTRVPFPESSPLFNISVSSIGSCFKFYRHYVQSVVDKRIGAVVWASGMLPSCMGDKKQGR